MEEAEAFVSAEVVGVAAVLETPAGLAAPRRWTGAEGAGALREGA